MIHVALFSFQRTTLSFEALASSDSFIVPHLFQTVKNFFIFLFCLSHPLQQGASNQGAFSYQAGVSRRLVLYYRTRRHLSTAFSKKLAKKSRIVKASTATRRRRGIPASISVFQFQSFSCRSDSISTTRRIQSAHITDLPCKPLRR